MSLKESVKISRDLEVVQIPEGYQVRLARGTQVRLMQALGDTFTVMTEYGTMVRVAGKDAEVIGEAVKVEEKPAGESSTAPASVETVRDRVWTALRSVYDPEIPVNVVELGLVYTNDVKPVDEGGYDVAVKMTLTAPGCGMGGVLKQDAEIKILSIPGVKKVNVEMVIDPPWNASMMSEAARLQLGL